MRKPVICLLLILCLVFPGASLAFAAEENVATIYRNGHVYAEDGAYVEAAVVKDGKYIYVGTAKGAEEAAGAGAKVYDLAGQYMLPGFFDAHCHPFMKHAFDLRDHVTEPWTPEKYVEATRAYLEANPGLQVLRGGGWDSGSFGDKPPQKELLDAISTDIPIVLSSYDGHSMWVNSKTLEIAGITRDTPVPSGAAIELNAQGDPCGTLREPAIINLVNRALPPVDVAAFEKIILAYQDYAVAHGLTGIAEAYVDLSTQLFPAYLKLAQEGKLKIRFSLMIAITPEEYESQFVLAEAALGTLAEANLGDILTMNTCKFFADGVVEGGTTYLTEPYASDHDWYGEPIWAPEEMLKAFRMCEALGLKIHTHSIGDAATKQTLDCLEQLSTRNRNALAHLQLLRPQDFQRYADLGLVAVPTPFWATRSETFEQVEIAALGRERAERTNPIKAFLDLGVHTAFSSDYPVTADPDPMIGLENAVTRTEVEKLRNGRTAEEMTLNPAEAITMRQGIACYALGGAYANNLEEITGSIAVGKSADFILLDKDLFQVLPTQTKILGTWFRGVRIYEAP